MSTKEHYHNFHRIPHPKRIEISKATMSQKGGDLFDMAKDGTKVPKHGAKLNMSTDEPVQTSMPEAGTTEPGVGEAMTGTGDALPSDIGGKATGSGGKNEDKIGAEKGGKIGSRKENY